MTDIKKLIAEHTKAAYQHSIASASHYDAVIELLKQMETDPNTDKTVCRGRTESGDYYTATNYLWTLYWESVETDWVIATKMEEGEFKLFDYDP